MDPDSRRKEAGDERVPIGSIPYQPEDKEEGDQGPTFLNEGLS